MDWNKQEELWAKRDHGQKKRRVRNDEFVFEQLQSEEYRRRQDRHIEENKAALHNLENEMRNIKRESTAFQTKQIEIFGVLVAFFTFVSVQMQIFSSINKAFFFPLSLLSLGGLLLFIAILSAVNIVRLHENKLNFLVPTTLLALVAVLLTFTGVVSYYQALSSLESCNSIRSQIVAQSFSDEELNMLSSGDGSAIAKVADLKRSLLMSECKE